MNTPRFLHGLLSRSHSSVASATRVHQRTNQRFIDKHIIVTGGANGIGRAIVEAFLKEGGTVSLLDKDTDTAYKYFKKNESYSTSTLKIYPIDVGNETQIQSTVKDIMVEHKGNLHVLVNNAAAFHFGTVDQASSFAWDTVINVNIKGYANMMKYCIPYLRETVTRIHGTDISATIPSPSAAIVNISSMSALIAQRSFVPYSTSKAAQLHMTRLVALDEASNGIRVNCVCPGPILTEATEKHAKGIGQPLDKVIDEMTSSLTIKRMGLPDEVARAVLFLASDDSSFTTGSHIMVDGGYTIM